jgi:NAD(P)-dependent dehydrogenase (short-subunit alcohol dehydrogenase family)
MESLQVNLTAPFALTRACLPLLTPSGDGSVVFVTDSARGPTRPYQAAYGVSKRALEALMQIWAAEVPKDASVRLNSFDPGPVRTALRARGYPGAPTDAVPPVESALPTLLWLLCDASRGVSGGQF